MMIQSIEEQLKSIFQEEPLCFLGANIYRRDIQTMLPHTELGSEAIHVSMEVIAQKYHDLEIKIMDPFITNMLIHMGDQPAILQSMIPQNIFTYDLIFIPSNTETKTLGKGSHWFLMVFQVHRNKIHIMDSAYEALHQNAKTMAKRLSDMRQMFTNRKQDIEVVRFTKVVKQENYFDCGIYVIGFFESVLKELQRQKKTKQQNKEYSFDIMNIEMDKNHFKTLRSLYFEEVITALRNKIKQKET